MKHWLRFKRPRIARISLKLFAAILLTNVLIGGMSFLLIARSLDQGFIDYLERTQANRADTLATALAERWQEHGNWHWLRDDPRAWHRLVRNQLWPGERQPPSGIDRELSDARDFVVLDAQGEAIIGRPLPPGKPPSDAEPPPQPRFIDIEHQGEVVGRLGYLPPAQLMARMDRIFLQRQLRNMTIIVASLSVASLLLAAGLAWWLGRRARDMTAATRRMTQGDFAVRLPERGHDELSRLSADFNVLAETLDANRRNRQQWVADIAHELRTPMAVLRGEIEAIEDGVRPLGDETLASLAQEVTQLERLVDDLRLLAQSDAGALDIYLAPHDLADTLQARLDESNSWLNARGITLDAEIGTAPAPIRGDPQRLRQLWNNLLSNTCAYTDAPGQLRIRLERHPDHLRLTWEDSAPGVAEETLPRLTERLYRVEGSRNRRSGGSGLGLAIASALVDAHGGTLTPSSSPLGGLRWTLVFPLHHADEALDNDAPKASRSPT
ncbi:ATP-binding protein [Chromohalobacter beijerinckii]|uniref:histidine kinase n=1 Tax=Chromohalobacter beijerinckii TaxID=86179 RepID=A0ABV8XIZ9_9GAMM|nr:ATP-binding protein [Chromohalobacter beijerinckii]MCK0764670.1 ATP-binding protein [Chromohalobacter beijerinckii]